MIKWVLIGEEDNISQDFIGGNFVEHPTEEVVAYFTSYDKANAYVDKRLLKHPKHESFFGMRIFKNDSSMSIYNRYRIEKYFHHEIPIDPE